jgi:hypothetical protein
VSEVTERERELQEELERVRDIASWYEHRRRLDASRRTRRQRAEASLLLVIGLLGGAVLFSARDALVTDPKIVPQVVVPASHTATTTQLSQRLAKVESALAAAATDSGTRSADEVERVATDLDALVDRVTLIEKSISNDPERALSIPLLRRDTEALTVRLTEMQVRADAEFRQLESTVQAIFWAMLSALGVLIITGIGLLARSVTKSDAKDASAGES